MKSYLNAALCAGLMLTMPSIKAGSTKDEWVALARTKMENTYLFANRVCDQDFFVVWPILGSVLGYDLERATGLFLKVNAGRLLVNLAAQKFDQMDQARASLVTWIPVWLIYSLLKSMARAA